jgi:hypothetical protein
MDFTLLRLLIRQPKRRKQPERYAQWWLGVLRFDKMGLD